MATNRCALLLAAATVLACTDANSPTTGKADVTLTVTGLDIDPNGFDLVVDGNSAKTIAGAGSVTVDLLVGQHTVTLGGLASNCTLQAPLVLPVTVSESGTVQIDFAIVCTAMTGVVKVTSATTGLDIDPDGYQVTVGANPVEAISTSGAAWIPNVAGGTQSLSVGSLAPNCHLAGSNPVDVNVSVGGLVRDTVQVIVDVTCTSVTGVVQVTTATIGPDSDADGYAVRIDVGPLYLMLTNGVGPIADVPGGAHSVALEGVAANCHVTGSNPVSISIAVGGLVRDTARVTFNVTCTRPPRTGVDFVVTTTGSNLDDHYHVVVYPDPCDYYCYSSWQTDLPANGTAPLTVPAASYLYSVTDIAHNCSGPTAGSFQVFDQNVTSVALAYTCLPAGTVTVDVHASGEDVQDYYSISLDGTPETTINAGGHVSFSVLAGTHAIRLYPINSNCTVAAANPVSVTVAASATVNVTFTVTCVPNPILRVTATTIGSHIPDTYLVGVDDDYYYGYVYTALVPSNGTVSIKVPADTHVVTLDQVPANCTVTSPNHVVIVVPPGGTTDLAFTVTCH